ncbi:peptidylprolyl isomerase [Flavobacterium branchiophilum]|uniref:Periplasmic chaperone PpiD n=1 Tax=Flavobacterium branchiophilum (strain FL-15) TaxID=1034807 RepID=G2Z3Y8_FLABF|nr:peptidylprolyl isomerase [Flavobacterium branchiophilum]CCB68319.1 Protein of unknown function [Flavobacterium branchiophilum FL-15]
MAVLAKIRQRSILLISIIAISLFAFIIQDFWRKGDFGSSKDVGSINGEDINFQSFNQKVNNLEKSGRGTTNIQAVNQVWEQEISLALLNAEFKKIGLRVGENQIVNALKQNQNIGQNKMFQNEAGVFDISKFKDYFKTNPDQAASLKGAEDDAALNAKYEIYGTLLKAGFHATKAEAKLKYEAETNKVTFDYVNVPYTAIKDSEVKISDAEITDYMKKNEKKYKTEEAREIQYVLIEDKPSAQDENDIKSSITSLLSKSVVYNATTKTNDTIAGFGAAKDVAEFVNANSDVPYDSTYIAKKDLPAMDADKLFNLPVGSVYGPYINGKYYCLSKSLGKKANVNAKASHILISYEGTPVPNKREKRTKEEAQAKAQALLAQALANPAGFMMMAFQYSDDSSAQQGGDLGYFSQGQMVKPFNDFVFNNGVGKIGLVETQFGFHIINVTDKQDAVRLATVARKIQASEKTTDNIYTQATKFEMDANAKAFEEVAKAMKLTVSPATKFKALDENAGGLGPQRQVIRWAFSKETNVGDIKRFEIANLGQVIAKYKKSYPAGLMAVEDARLSVEPVLKNKKKAEMIKAKLKGTSLEAMATANQVKVQNAADVTLENAVLQNIGQEAKVVGTAFGIGANKTSSPIDGNAGVYVVRTKAVTKALALKDYNPYLAKVKAANAGKINGVIPALKANAKIVDNRANFNY